ncbi:MAG TPA: primosomal protein N' [Spirochaetota bacterium]
MRYADIYLPVPVEGPFTYAIPDGMNVLPGVRVVAPFGRRTETGFVARIHDVKPEGFVVKEILSVIDEGPIFDDSLVSLGRRVAFDYICSTGEVLSVALPSAKSSSTRGEGFSVPETTVSEEIKLSDEQSRAFNEICQSRDTGKAHLLYGVTGSGKTEIYISLVQKVLAEGKSSIVLVPEISLSAQLFERFALYFGKELVLYHSNLSPNQRLSSWKKFYRGEARVVVGTRSAAFMQCPSLGLVIIDEEHDGSYKEHSTPRYNARRVAMCRQKEGAFLLLGSATPSIESLYTAKSGVMGLSRLDTRYGNARLPSIEIVGIEGKRDDDIFSTELKIATKHAIDAGRQAILLLNRRGFSPIVFCRSCKKKIECPHCSISMNFHGSNDLICHYCGYSRPMPDKCPSCGSDDIAKLGSGTQRVEHLIDKTFQGKRIFRLDQDSARKKDSSRELLDRMRDGEIDILVGTQMVAKGFDFKKVDVVGVILADIGMNLPDFRAAERIFSLLSQVAGRCGRGDNPGRVIVQTLNPSQELLLMMARGEYDLFYEKELAMRKILSYPPFSRLARFLLRGADEKKVIEGADRVAELVQKSAKGHPAIILGPSPAPLARIGGNHRHHLIVKARDGNLLRSIARAAYEGYGRSDPYLEIDIDPFDML